MSLTPDTAPDQVSATHSRSNRVMRWCFAIFTFEIGLFLAVFPWVYLWDWNYFQDLFPALEIIWDDPYLRGALTGLGLVNIYVACLEVVKLLRKK
jgi:hypothetical protein